MRIGLYRDDGRAVGDLTPRQMELVKKEICKIFQNQDLKITIVTNIKVVDFLDVTLDLNTRTHKPYNKPNNTPLYINMMSNHPPCVLKNIPLAVQKRLSKNSSTKEIFEAAIPPYQEALKVSGYSHKLEFEENLNATNANINLKKNRKRKTTWFNPPYSKSMATNLGAKFLKLVDKSFPKYHPLQKIFNRNTLKLSYKCMPNMQRVISGHNSRILREEIQEKQEQKKQEQETQEQQQEQSKGRGKKKETADPDCNCREGVEVCPLEGKCKEASVIYRATVKDENSNTETYTGLTSNTFKKRYYGHNSDINNREKQGTTLSEHIWKLKDQNLNYNLSWEIITKAQSFNPSTKKCRLCLTEKYYIAFKPEGATLNKRSEMFACCRHRKKQLLENT